MLDVQDVNRTFPEVPFFQSEEVGPAMLHRTVWGRESQDVAEVVATATVFRGHPLIALHCGGGSCSGGTYCCGFLSALAGSRRYGNIAVLLRKRAPGNLLQTG